MNKIKGIYKITNTINNKCYIGKSVNIDRRFSAHKICQEDKPLYRAFNKYSLDNFTFEVLHNMGEDVTEDDLLDFEYLYKLHYKSYVGNGGYNLIEGREDPHKSPGPESRAKMSAVNSGVKNNMYGKKHTPESINKNMLSQKTRYTVQGVRVETGEKTEVFNSLRSAARWLGDVKKVTHISDVINGKAKTAYGYYWEVV